jgi:regulation of enolase protein 1 (concanavalin A-like superfamily)
MKKLVNPLRRSVWRGVLALLLSTVALSQISAQQTVSPVADTDSQSDNAAGTNTTLNISQWCHLFVKFDLSSVSGSVSNAVLRIHKNSASSGLTVYAHTTSNDTWTEGSAKPTIVNQIASLAVPNAAGYFEINLTSFVQGRMSANKIVSVGLSSNSGTWTQVNSRQASTGKPELVVTVSGGGGGTLPSPWLTQDIGSTGVAGSASHTNGTFTVAGSGNDIWGTADGFRYVYRSLSGDGQITARVTSQTNTDPWAKAGVMIRETLTAGSKHAMTVITPTNGLSFQRRASTGGESVGTTTTGISVPVWVRIVRQGSTFTSFRSSDGSSWTQVGSATISMGSNVYVGLAVTSHNNSVLSTAAFTNVSVGTVAPPPPPPPASMLLGTNFWNFGWGNGRADYFNSGINWSTVTNPWRQAFLNDISIYRVIRFMDQVPTNSSNVVNWSERTPKTADHYTTPGGAVAYEWQVDLCNRVNADIWITVPHRTIESYEANASNNYFTQLAALLKSQLNSNLNIYLEYSNETWSGGASFQQGDYAGNRGVQMGFDSDHYTAKFYFHVYAAMRLHKVFLDAFAGQTHRIKTVIAGQDGSFWGTQQQMLALDNQTWSQGPKSNLNPWNLTPTYYTIANYISTGDGAATNVRSAWTTQLNSAANYYQQVKTEVAKKGMKLVAYEGGQHYTQNAHLFSQNPQSYDMYLEWLNKVKDYFDLTCHYTHVGTWSSGGAWGAKSSTDQSVSNAHKYRALRDWVQANGGARVGSEPEIALSETVQVYPNPAREQIHLRIQSGKAQPAALSLTAPSGRSVLRETIQLQAGENRFTLPLGELGSGLYLIQVQQGNERVVKKVIVTQ